MCAKQLRPLAGQLRKRAGIPIRLLLAGQSDEDAKLIIDELRNGGYQPESKHLDSTQDIRKALRNGHWDLIIAECSPPRATGHTALDILKEFDLDIPVIFVCGAVETDTALGLLLAGAKDVLTTNEISRLVLAAVRELSEAESRRKYSQAAESALVKSEARFRATFDRAGIGMTIIDITGHVLAANSAFAEFIGYSQEELATMSVWQYAYQEDVAHGDELLYEMIDGKRESFQTEKRYVTKSGRVIWGRLTASIARNPAPEQPFIIGMIEDIDVQKTAEERARQVEAEKVEFYRRTIQAATNGKLIVTDHQEIEQMLGPEIMQTGIETRKDLPRARRRLSEGARSQGMDHHQIDMMLTAVGEATSNVLKHAGGGRLSLHRIDDTLMCVVRDHGPGIQALNLPSVALMPGYSTVGTLGMGYKLMIATSDKVYLATGQGGTTLAMQFTISEEAMARRRGDFVTW